MTRKETEAYLECREHLALLLSVYEAVLVLHRDERREIVVDGIVYRGNELRELRIFSQ